MLRASPAPRRDRGAGMRIGTFCFVGFALFAATTAGAGGQTPALSCRGAQQRETGGRIAVRPRRRWPRRSEPSGLAPVRRPRIDAAFSRRLHHQRRDRTMARPDRPARSCASRANGSRSCCPATPTTRRGSKPPSRPTRAASASNPSASSYGRPASRSDLHAGATSHRARSQVPALGSLRPTPALPSFHVRDSGRTTSTGRGHGGLKLVALDRTTSRLFLPMCRTPWCGWVIFSGNRASIVS